MVRAKVSLWSTVFILYVRFHTEDTGFGDLSCFFLLLLGVQSDKPDLVPRTPPPIDNLADAEADLSTSSLGSAGVGSASPPLR